MDRLKEPCSLGEFLQWFVPRETAICAIFVYSCTSPRGEIWVTRERDGMAIVVDGILCASDDPGLNTIFSEASVCCSVDAFALLINFNLLFSSSLSRRPTLHPVGFCSPFREDLTVYTKFDATNPILLAVVFYINCLDPISLLLCKLPCLTLIFGEIVFF